MDPDETASVITDIEVSRVRFPRLMATGSSYSYPTWYLVINIRKADIGVNFCRVRVEI